MPVTRFAAVLAAFVLVGCGSSTPSATPSPIGAPTPSPAPSPASTATPNKLTSAQVAQVKKILGDSLKRYRTNLAAGKAALGTTQYADAGEAVTAFYDPTSDASKFRDWRSSSQAQYDVSFSDAFSEADDFYNADNEPAAIGDWRDDMSDVQWAGSDWIEVAVSWKIREATTYELIRAEGDLQAAFNKAQKDIDLVVAQSQ